jgi:hypothetical protein
VPRVRHRRDGARAPERRGDTLIVSLLGSNLYDIDG